MKFSFGLDKHIQDKVKNFADKNSLNQEEIDELVLIVNMTFSSGHHKGSKNANTVSRTLGTWSNNN